MCVRFSNLNSLYKLRALSLSKSGALSLSHTHTHTQRAAHDDDLSLCSFFLARVFVCVYVSARYVCSIAGKILCGRLLKLFFLAVSKEKIRESRCLFGEKRRGKKNTRRKKLFCGRFLSRRSDIRITTCRIISLKTPLSLSPSLSLSHSLSDSVNLIC